MTEPRSQTRDERKVGLTRPIEKEDSHQDHGHSYSLAPERTRGVPLAAHIGER